MKKSRTMKKIIACLLVIALMSFLALTACGVFDRSGNDQSPSDVETAAEQTEPEETSDAKEEASEEAEPKIDYLVIVNSRTPVPEGWEENLTLSYTCNSVGDDVYAETETYKAYLEMKDELEKQGVHVELDSGFRSLAYQQQIIDEFTEKYGAAYAKAYAAVPGYSEHHTGLALDLYLIVDGVTAYENEDLMKYPEVWKKIHALLPDYGFILTYPNNGKTTYEPGHIRYVGKEAAKTITEKGITLEEYVNSLS